MILNGIEYEEMIVLPRWAYHDEEWFDVKMVADKLIDGIYYVKVTEEPSHDAIDELMKLLL